MQTNKTIQRALQLRTAVNIVWQSGRLWAITNVGLLIVQGILPLASLYLLKLVLDEVTEQLDAVGSGANFEQVLVLIGLAGLVALIGGVANTLSRLANDAQGEAVSDHVHRILHAKSVEIDLEYYEKAEYYNKLHRAQSEALYRPVEIVNGLMQVGQNGISLIAMAWLLISLHWAAALVLLAAAIPGVFIRLRYSRILFRWRRNSTAAERQAEYYDWMLVDGEHAKEIRLFNLGELFIERFAKQREKLRQERLTILKRWSIAELITQLSGTVAIFGTYAFLAFRTIQGTITLGDMVMYYQAFQRGQSFLVGLLRNLANLYEDSLFLTYLNEFLDLEPIILPPPNPKPLPRSMHLEFHDVSFRYQPSSREALSHINLTIRPGEMIALVGENGAGKTTLIKLLCRLYDPTKGQITINGIDLRAFDPVDLRREISVILQDYQHYNVTARENIWFGDIDLSPGSDRISDVAQKSGAHVVVEELPQGYETVLGKVFEDGEELSIGQWQMIALARAFLRDSQLIVFDEPTSALDAMAEHEVISRFRELIGNRSALLISHRLSTVKMADRIYVLENQTVAEHGTHDELILQNGIYARLFATQATPYV